MIKLFFKRVFCLHYWNKKRAHKLALLYDCEMTCEKCGKIKYTDRPDAYVSFVPSPPK